MRKWYASIVVEKLSVLTRGVVLGLGFGGSLPAAFGGRLTYIA